MPAGHKILLPLRHAKSDWDSGAVDHERPLNARGQRDAVAVGKRLAAQHVLPDLVVCSAAVRTRQTWDRAVVGGAKAGEVRYLDEIYQAGAAGLMEVVRRLPEEADIVLLIGHSPGVPDLIDLLGSRTDDSAWARLDQGYPTASLAVLSLAGAWSQVAPGLAQLVAFEVPRGIAPN